jgi:hypothetical protein
MDETDEEKERRGSREAECIPWKACSEAAAEEEKEKETE